MTSTRDRIFAAPNSKESDQLLKVLVRILSTGIGAFAYPGLVSALGLPPRPARVSDTLLCLALPELDMLNALGCDVATLCVGITNAFDEAENRALYDFFGRLSGRIRNPEIFQVQQNSTIVQAAFRKPPSSYVFKQEHGGHALSFLDGLPKEDLVGWPGTYRPACCATSRLANYAICVSAFFNDVTIVPNISNSGHGGLGIFPALCLAEPDYITELYEIHLSIFLSPAGVDVEEIIVDGKALTPAHGQVDLPAGARAVVIQFG